MKQLAAIILVSTIFISINACTDNRKAKNYNVGPDTGVSVVFVQKCLENGNAELSLSKLALRNSRNPEVINYAKRMVDEHTKAAKDLKKIAKEQGVKVLDSLSTIHGQAMAALSKKLGPDFDKDYIQAMVQDHEQTITLLKSAATSNNKNVSDFANKMLPIIQDHLKQANIICAKLK
ncbi:hypothetical protein A0256_19145 [Mucilaginibacter sp. PAMC 26640]|nr:hypothetical protein A0256_19145 [Mucilaginibacter sp. PAMC 26640]